MLGLVAASLTSNEITERFHFSTSTAKTHVNWSMPKIGARDRAQLVVMAYQAGLARPVRDRRVTATTVHLAAPRPGSRRPRGSPGTGHRPGTGRAGALPRLPAGQQAVNQYHAKIRALGGQTVATLKTWRLLRKLRRSTTRITDPVRDGGRPYPNPQRHSPVEERKAVCDTCHNAWSAHRLVIICVPVSQLVSAVPAAGSSSIARGTAPGGLRGARHRLQRAQSLGDGTTSGVIACACGQELQELVLPAFLTAGQAPYRQKAHEVTKDQDGEGRPLECQHRNPPRGHLPDDRRRLTPASQRGVTATMTPTI